MLIDLDLSSNTLALDDDQTIRMKHSMVHLGSILAVLKPQTVEDHDGAIFSKSSPEVVGHLLLASKSAGLGQDVL